MDEELDMLMGDDSPGLSQADLEDALKSVSTSWLKKIELGLKHKTPFTRDAREAMNFFDGKGDWFWKKKPIQENGTVDVEPPTFRMTVNKTFEAVKLFGAVMYARNPVRTVTPRKYPAVPPSALGIDINQPPQIDPMTGVPVEDPAIANFIATSNAVMMAEEQKASVAKLIEAYLNYTPNKLDLKEHSKKVVDEAIIKGLGVWWTEIVEIPTDEGEPYRMVGSFFGSADDIVWDPDADEQEDARWVARRCVGTRAELAAQYERPIDDFKGVAESNAAKEEEGTRGYKTKQRNGQTNDQVVYWKIYSKTGFGHTLKGAREEYRKTFDALGENCYIVVSEGVDYPLNVPKEVAAEEPDEETGMPASLHGRTRWPIPFYQENNGWPCTLLQFHRKSGYSWPISHMKPGMPELKFMNWVMSFLATRAITSCKTLIGIAKAAESDLEQVILKGDKNGFTFFRISETLGRSVEDLISVLQLPPVSREIWDVLKEVSEQFDKRVGLTELVFGMTRNQFRSAAEAQVKAEQISVRPDDMANTLEDAMSMLSRREALALQWLLEPTDVAPVLGPLGAQAWEKLVTPLSVSQIAMEFDYRIEAGSARKPNKASRVEQMQMAVQNIGPVLQGLIMQGNPGPWNALMAAWCDSIDLDPAPFMIPPPPPPPPPPPALPPMGPADAPPGAPPGEPGGGAPPEPPPMPMPDQIPPELDPGI